jgi:hypothetical protein
MPAFFPDSKNSRKPLCANDLITIQVYSVAIRLSRDSLFQRHMRLRGALRFQRHLRLK